MTGVSITGVKFRPTHEEDVNAITVNWHALRREIEEYIKATDAPTAPVFKTKLGQLRAKIGALQPGEHVDIFDYPACNLYRYCRPMGWQIKTQKLDGGGCRVWLVSKGTTKGKSNEHCLKSKRLKSATALA